MGDVRGPATKSVANGGPRSERHWEPPTYYEMGKPKASAKTLEKDKDTTVSGFSLKEFIGYYGETTGFQGIPKVWAARDIYMKVLWGICFLVATAFAIIQLRDIIEEYSSFPVSTSIKLGFSPLPFPAVTFCNANPIRLSKAHLASCALQAALEIPTEFRSTECQNYTDSLEEYLGYSPGQRLCDYDSDNDCIEFFDSLDLPAIRRNRINDLLAEESSANRAEMGHDIYDMLLSCEIAGRECQAENFTRFLSTEFGNCYTFLPSRSLISHTGLNSGLIITLNLESEEFLDAYKTGYGLRLIVHENGTWAYPTSEGISVSSAYDLNLGLRQVIFLRAQGEYGSCNDSDTLEKIFGIKYSELACRNLWHTLQIAWRCQCVPGNDVDLYSSDTFLQISEVGGDLRVCSTRSDWECESRINNEISLAQQKGQDLSNCNSPCREVTYGQSMSGRSWPLFKHVKDLDYEVCKRNNYIHPKCLNGLDEFEVYDVETYEKRRASYVRLNIFYETLNFETITEKPAYTTERFLSDIGGTIGLWIGASVLSLAELAEILIDVVVTFIASRCRKPKRAREDTDIVTQYF